MEFFDALFIPYKMMTPTNKYIFKGMNRDALE
jgi:hypothetical protein